MAGVRPDERTNPVAVVWRTLKIPRQQKHVALSEMLIVSMVGTVARLGSATLSGLVLLGLSHPDSIIIINTNTEILLSTYAII